MAVKKKKSASPRKAVVKKKSSGSKARAKTKAKTKVKSKAKSKAKKKSTPKKKTAKKKTAAKKTTTKATKKTRAKVKKASTKAKKTTTKKAAPVKKKVAPKKAAASVPTPTQRKVKSPAKPRPAPVVEEPVEKPVHKEPPPRNLDPIILKIRSQLIQQRNELMTMIKSSQEVERNIGEITFSNEIDLASSLEGREMAFQLSSRERNELKLIEEALFKMAKGTYGVCEGCSKNIPVKRLQIMPLTPLCIECQENLEVS